MKYIEKLRDPRWQKKRLQILERDGFACQSCYDTETTLHVHHCTYTANVLAGSVDNLGCAFHACTMAGFPPHVFIDSLAWILERQPEVITDTYFKHLEDRRLKNG